jgi:ankyrin repeat protein
MFAAFYSNIDAIEFLAASDANLNFIDVFGRNALHYAS